MDTVMSLIKKNKLILMLLLILIFIASSILAALQIIYPNFIFYINISVFDLKKFSIDHPTIVAALPAIFIVIALATLVLFLLLLLFREKELVILGSNDVYSTKNMPQYKVFELILKTSMFDKKMLISGLKDLYDFKIKITEVIKKEPFLMIICSLPFAAEFGYYLGNCISNINYLHYNREQKKCIELKEKNNDYDFSHSYIDNNSKELFVAVQSSFLIDINNLDKKFKDKNILTITNSVINVDSIDNLTILNCFSNYIIEQIRDCYDKNEVVHIAFATSALVAFNFGRLISKTIDKKIICYQYNNQEKNNRPWGIYINGNDVNFEEQIIYDT